ncbi:MAG: hypothetical protein KatS3mg114_1398 [Planctomycetaceae bacterium]|nr:MAG: hypothetical protein KatS3mg114_1398 [Planctomycetaceae bacterium]
MNRPRSPMQNCSRASARNSLWCWLSCSQQLLQRRLTQQPALFRQLIRLSPQAPLLREQIQPWQERDFRRLDAAWRHVAQRDSAAPSYCRAYFERPRGHSKTTDLAVQVAWALQYADHRVQGVAAAADRDQAALLLACLQRLVSANPQWCPDLCVSRQTVWHRRTGSRLDVLSSDVNSSWGLLCDFMICDELCHWPRPDLWYSLASAAAKQPHTLLVVISNAGVGQGWTWHAREQARTSPDWIFSSLAGSQAPWIAPQLLDEQQRLLPPSLFRRLWLNEWQQAEEQFLTATEIGRCRDEQLQPCTAGEPHRHYVAALDYAEKHDRTVGVIVHLEGDRIIVDRMDVVAPTPEHPVPVAWVDDWIAQTVSRFPSVQFVVDEYQLLGTIQRWQSQVTMQRFDFAGTRGHHALALLLRQLIVHQRLRWYPGCGALPDQPEDNLESELARLTLYTAPSGRVRLQHPSAPGCHDDRAFALGAACLTLCQRDEVPADCLWTPPTSVGDFRWWTLCFSNPSS